MMDEYHVGWSALLDFDSDLDYEVLNTTEIVKPHEKDTEWAIVDMTEDLWREKS